MSFYDKEHTTLGNYIWRYAVENVAMQLFYNEREDNPLRTVDRSHRWDELTPEDRLAYRLAANKLMMEEFP